MSGKIDRHALPPPEADETHAGVGRREPADAVERLLLEIWQEVLGLRSLGVEENFFELGGTSIQAAVLTNLLQERLGDYVYPVALFDAPTIAELALYLERLYPAAVARLRGETLAGEEEDGPRVDDAMIAAMREVIGSRGPLRRAPQPKNPRAVFLLSPPRSGSTLLRVMLAGNRHLFAPPELELLGFDTIGERAAELSGRFGLWKEGTVRAVMELWGCGMEEAAALLEDMETADLSVPELYRQLQEWAEGRMLVDKTPSYALDRTVLERAEETFDEPLYVHLLRHPYGMIASFEEAKLEQVFFRPEHSFPRRRLAELIWLVSQENIREHLREIPAHRQLPLRFEDLVRSPRAELERLCGFLGVPFEEGMLDPYAEKERKMTDGIHALSRMLGDVKFHTHAGVDPRVADRWKEAYRRDFLGEETWRVARELGYSEPAERSGGHFSSLVRLRAGGPEPPLFLVHPMGGGALCYRDLAVSLGDEQPVYGLQSRGLGADEEPDETVEAMAAHYLEEVRAAWPAGPYRLAGWSLGGDVAFEMAQRLVRDGATVELVALLDTVAPGAIPPAGFDETFVLRAFAQELGTLVGGSLGIEEEEVQGMTGEEGVRFILRRAQEKGAVPADFGVEQAVRLWRVASVNLRASQLYQAAVYPGRLTLLAAEQSQREGVGPDLGWGPLAAGGIERLTIEARHATLLRGSGLEAVAEALRGCLRRRGALYAPSSLPESR